MPPSNAPPGVPELPSLPSTPSQPPSEGLPQLPQAPKAPPSSPFPKPSTPGMSTSLLCTTSLAAMQHMTAQGHAEPALSKETPASGRNWAPHRSGPQGGRALSTEALAVRRKLVMRELEAQGGQGTCVSEAEHISARVGGSRPVWHACMMDQVVVVQGLSG